MATVASAAAFAVAVIVLRRLLPLRQTGRELEGFPVAREYRVFVAQGEPLAMGFYWPFGTRSAS